MLDLNSDLYKNLEFHHLGVLVADLQQAIINYSLLFGKESISKIYDIESQQIRVCFVNTGKNSFLELIQPNIGNTSFDKFFKKNINFYHIAFLTKTFDSTTQDLLNNDFKCINTFQSEAFENKRCAFFMSNEMHIIEIIES